MARMPYTGTASDAKVPYATGPDGKPYDEAGESKPVSSGYAPPVCCVRTPKG
jgi:hypothetical protein